MKKMTLLAKLFLCLAIATIEAKPGLLFYNNVTKNIIPRTYDGPLQGRIINGVDSKLFQRPYQASFQVYDPLLEQWGHFCGAVIIGPNVLACAAHCFLFFPNEKLRIEVGVLDLAAPPLKYTQIVDVASLKHHEDFVSVEDTSAFPNDIGLIFTKQRIVFNENVKPIEIASSEKNFTGQECVISGWGRTQEDGEYSTVLHETKMRIWSYEDCHALHATYGYDIDRNHICIKGESDVGLVPGACVGDSGGPLVCGNKHLYLFGVTSYAFGVCSTDFPNVYTRVPGFIDWIFKTYINTIVQN